MQWIIVPACAVMGGLMMKNPYYFKKFDELFPCYNGGPTRLYLAAVRLCGLLLVALAVFMGCLFLFY